MMFVIGCVCILLVLLYVYYAKKPGFWQERNVKHVKPYPLIGNFFSILSGKFKIFEWVDNMYNAFSSERYVGLYNIGGLPILMIRDPELIKKVMVKDFDVFPVRSEFVHEDMDHLWTKNLFSSRGITHLEKHPLNCLKCLFTPLINIESKWRQLRPTLSPAFTSSKMKYMFVLVKECAEDFAQFFLDKNESLITIKSKDVFTRYTNDVIASVAFGVECNSLRNPNNEFYKMGADAANFTGLRVFKFMMNKTIAKLFNIKIFSQQVRTFFTKIVEDTISIREKQNIVRPDMMQLLTAAMKGHTVQEENVSVDTGFATVEETNSSDKKSTEPLTILDITAQALIFFIAGFDTTSAVMCYMAHELALNPDVQEKLRNEIDECNGNITYEKLMSLKYLDMVISETLRKWPPVIVGDRCSVKSYTIARENPDEEPIHIPKKTSIWLPVYSIHRDPQYYPEPNKFDPERFSDENKSKINPYTYMPFGLGPRNCIGSRFALMECKLLFFYIIKSFEIHIVEKTPVNMEFTSDMAMIPVGGWWVGFKPRQS